MFSFMLLSLCCRAFESYEDFSIKSLAISGGVALALIASSYFLAEDKGTGNIVMGLIFVLMFAVMAVLIVLFRKDKFHKWLLALLCLAIVIESGSNAVYVVLNKEATGGVIKYIQFDNAMSEFTEKYNADEDEFYRTDIYENWTFDSPQLYGMKGTTYYSSTMSEAAFNFFKNFGMRVYAKNVSTIYTPYSPITNAVFGIKYIANRNMISLPYGLTELEKIKNIKVVENENCLPVAFICDEDALNWTNNVTLSYLENQDTFFSALSGDDTPCFTKIDWDSSVKTNASVLISNVWANSTFTCADKGQCRFSFEFTVKEAGEYYICDNFTKGDYKITVNDEEYTPYIDRVTHVCIGQLEIGDKITVTVSEDGVGTSYYGMELYKFNEEAFQKKFDTLNKYGMTVTECKNGHIEGTISSDGGTVCTSIGQENDGFTVYIDGEEVETQLIAGYMLSFNVSAGEHTVVIDYSVPGLTVGIICSVPFVVLFAVLYIIMKRRKKQLITQNEV